MDSSIDAEQLTRLYLIWLGGKVTRSSRHTELMEILFNKQFVWVVANDSNRIQDALDLRREFLLDAHFGKVFQVPEAGKLGQNTIEQFRSNEASVLEVLIGISRRLSFLAGGIAEVWAWKLVENLELHHMKDPLSAKKRDEINEVLDSLIFRTYQKNGQGGFFPLGYPDDDQTKVEIWYQMSAYIEENQLP